MRKLVDLIGMTVGGWLGWRVGAIVGVFTAFIVGVVGTGLGMFLARRATRHLLP